MRFVKHHAGLSVTPFIYQIYFLSIVKIGLLSYTGIQVERAHLKLPTVNAVSDTQVLTRKN